nr:hypothetical protein [Staphylococcus aureus]
MLIIEQSDFEKYKLLQTELEIMKGYDWIWDCVTYHLQQFVEC